MEAETMDYQRHYDLLIDKAKNRQLNGYLEKHHIVPRCLGGTDDKDNLVALTPEEHYVAHQLLVKMYPENDSLVYAANKMTVTSKYAPRNNKRYGWLKRKYQSVCKKRVGNKNPSFGRSWYYNPDTLENGKFLEHEVPAGWIRGRNPKKPKRCKKCGQTTCVRKEICYNGHRIKRFIDNFGFNKACIGTSSFYEEYDRVVEKLRSEYIDEKYSVEDLRIKYKINHNETMRKILESLEIKRRNLSESIKSYYEKK